MFSFFKSAKKSIRIDGINLRPLTHSYVWRGDCRSHSDIKQAGGIYPRITSDNKEDACFKVYSHFRWGLSGYISTSLCRGPAVSAVYRQWDKKRMMDLKQPEVSSIFKILMPAIYINVYKTPYMHLARSGIDPLFLRYGEAEIAAAIFMPYTDIARVEKLSTNLISYVKDRYQGVNNVYINPEHTVSRDYAIEILSISNSEAKQIHKTGERDGEIGENLIFPSYDIAVQLNEALGKIAFNALPNQMCHIGPARIGEVRKKIGFTSEINDSKLMYYFIDNYLLAQKTIGRERTQETIAVSGIRNFKFI